jgi:hypothetical protein
VTYILERSEYLIKTKESIMGFGFGVVIVGHHETIPIFFPK